METTRRRRIFRDVVRGYTTTLLDGEFVYIKHLTPHDQVELEEIEEKYYQNAQRRGVPTEAEMLAYLKEEGQWTDADEKVITEKTLYLENLKTTLNKLILKADVERQKSIIAKETKLLNEKTAQKIQLVGNTCERYAKDRLNDFYIIKSFYKNQELTEQLFTQDEYDELESQDIKKPEQRTARVYGQARSIQSGQNAGELTGCRLRSCFPQSRSTTHQAKPGPARPRR